MLELILGAKSTTSLTTSHPTQSLLSSPDINKETKAPGYVTHPDHPGQGGRAKMQIQVFNSAHGRRRAGKCDDTSETAQHVEGSRRPFGLLFLGGLASLSHSSHFRDSSCADAWIPLSLPSLPPGGTDLGIHSSCIRQTHVEHPLCAAEHLLGAHSELGCGVSGQG